MLQTLNDVMKMELIEDKTYGEIRQVRCYCVCVFHSVMYFRMYLLYSHQFLIFVFSCSLITFFTNGSETNLIACILMYFYIYLTNPNLVTGCATNSSTWSCIEKRFLYIKLDFERPSQIIIIYCITFNFSDLGGIS